VLPVTQLLRWSGCIGGPFSGRSTAIIVRKENTFTSTVTFVELTGLNIDNMYGQIDWMTNAHMLWLL
jgi:hypothetical protein